MRSKLEKVFEYFPTYNTSEHDEVSRDSRIIHHVTYLGRQSMTRKRLRTPSSSNNAVSSAQSTNPVSTSSDQARLQEEVLADLKCELAATKARCLQQETSIEDLKSRLSGLEKHVGTQLLLMEQNMTKFIVVIPPEASEEASQSAPSSRVFELVMSPKSCLKKVMRQAIRQYMFSNSGSIFASSNREALGRKCNFFLYVIDIISSFTKICDLQLIEGCECK